MYPDCENWYTIDTRTEYENRYPYLPPRIIDQLMAKEVKISVTGWSRIGSRLENLAFLIDSAYNSKTNNKYDLSREMRMRDS